MELCVSTMLTISQYIDMGTLVLFSVYAKKKKKVEHLTSVDVPIICKNKMSFFPMFVVVFLFSCMHEKQSTEVQVVCPVEHQAMNVNILIPDSTTFTKSFRKKETRSL